MAGRLAFHVALVVTGALIGSLAQALAASTLFTHYGRAVEHKTFEPLDVTVTAWADKDVSDPNGACPGDGKLLDQESSSGGQFVVSIDKSFGVYTLVYCRNGYVPRTDHMSNAHSGTSVRPTPADLWPAKISKDDDDAYDDDIDAIVTTFLNNISYFRKVSEPGFERAISGLAERFARGDEGRSALIRNLPDLARRWGDGSTK